MSANKTVETKASVPRYFAQIKDEARRKDCIALADLMTEATKESPKMWGSSIVGFGSYHYRYESGGEGDTCLVGFSSRKADLTIYGLGMMDVSSDLLAQLGKYKTGKGCLYLKKLGDINPAVLRKLITDAVARKKGG